MKDSLFRDWDNGNKYVKAPYQGASAKIGHLEYLYDYLKENALADWVLETEGYGVGEVLFDTDGLYRNTLEGNTSQPSVNSPANGWVLLVQSASVPTYKTYVANILQSGTNAPTQTIHNNTFGNDGVWVYGGVGSYRISFPTGTIPDPSKVVIIPPVDKSNNSSFSSEWYGIYVDIDTIYLETGYVNNTTGVKTASNGVLYAPGWTMEIKVYN